MRYISIVDASAGMVIASDIMDSHGRMLVAGKSRLTERYIKKLMDMEIFGIYIEDEISEGITISAPVPTKLRSEGIDAARKGDIDKCKSISREIVREIVNNENFSLDMANLYSYDDYTFAHSMNVAIYACTIGLGLDLKQDILEDVVLAGILHDMGKLEIPEEILNKNGRLTPEEFVIMKQHPRFSYELISARRDISAWVKNAVLCHHENHDGSGYPNGLDAKNITQIAAIIHVADVYDALVSKRPYKEPYSPFAAIEILQGGSGVQFNPEVVNAFVKYVPIYPKGQFIELEDGRRGIVIENSGVHNLRPVIRLLDKTEMDLNSGEYLGIRIVSSTEENYLEMLEEEAKRKMMIQPVRKCRLIVIDSVGDTYFTINNKLSGLYEIRHVISANQAEGYIKKDGYPDVLVTDIDGMGMQEIAEHKRRLEHIVGDSPVLYIGNMGEVSTINELKKIGIINYILKPFRIIYLHNEIQRLL